MYDVWGIAISLPELDSKHKIRVPLLGINSEAFMYWPDNFNVAKAICEEARRHGSLHWLMTVRGAGLRSSGTIGLTVAPTGISTAEHILSRRVKRTGFGLDESN
jgi:hypothetical protein